MVEIYIVVACNVSHHNFILACSKSKILASCRLLDPVIFHSRSQNPESRFNISRILCLQYYDVVRDFITKLEPLIKDDYEEMTSSIVEFLPMLKGKRARDVITALIWNCAVVHFSDHHSYLRWFASTYGCMCMRSELV